MDTRSKPVDDLIAFLRTRESERAGGEGQGGEEIPPNDPKES